MSENERKKPFWFLYEYQEATGNMWGWKFSKIGALVIGGLIAIAVYRHITMDVPFGYDAKVEDEQFTHPLHRKKTVDTARVEQ